MKLEDVSQANIKAVTQAVKTALKGTFNVGCGTKRCADGGHDFVIQLDGASEVSAAIASTVENAVRSVMPESQPEINDVNKRTLQPA